MRDAVGRTVHARARRTRLDHGGERQQDVVLEAGESFPLARSGLAVVEAFSDASISIA